LMLNSNREINTKPQKPKALRREYYYAKQGFKITMRSGLRFSRSCSRRRGRRAPSVFGR
jgi:hypothetical protein